METGIGTVPEIAEVIRSTGAPGWISHAVILRGGPQTKDGTCNRRKWRTVRDRTSPAPITMRVFLTLPLWTPFPMRITCMRNLIRGFVFKL